MRGGLELWAVFFQIRMHSGEIEECIRTEEKGVRAAHARIRMQNGKTGRCIRTEKTGARAAHARIRMQNGKTGRCIRTEKIGGRFHTSVYGCKAAKARNASVLEQKNRSMLRRMIPTGITGEKAGYLAG